MAYRPVGTKGSWAWSDDSQVAVTAALADGTYSGATETGTIGTAALIFGDVAYFATATSKWEKTNATTAATSGLKIGVCVLAGNSDAATTILLYGKVRADAAFPAFTIGEKVYLSAAAAGDLVTAAPTGTTGFVVRIAGYGNTADELYFCPENSYLVLA